MSTSRVDISGLFGSPKANLHANLSLSADSLKVRRNGIEFHSLEPIPNWTELSINLVTPCASRKIACRGVVVSCTGNRTFGYNISLLFMNLSKTSQAALNKIAFGAARS